jgi:hypothetical protein
MGHEMKRIRSAFANRVWLLALAVFALCAVVVAAQSVLAQGAPAPAKAGPPLAPRSAAKHPAPQYRHLAKGVETTIPVMRDTDETVSVHDMVDILYGTPNLEWKPNYLPQTETLAAKAKDVPFRRSIWNLEFTFKPLRMIYVDVPQPTGRMERKLIWYMVYHVKNPGGHLAPKQRDADETVSIETAAGAPPEQIVLPKGTFGVESTDKVVLAIDPEGKPREALKFMPLFVLESFRIKTPKAYTDHIIPVAVPEIQRREDPNRKLLNSVEMAATTIPLSTDRIDRSVWGVVTWEDIDPTTDYFSIYIQGLTNAYKWTDDKDQIKEGTPPGTGRKFVQRTLKLNFWRPADEYLQNEKEIRFGIPGEVDYDWVWRP